MNTVTEICNALREVTECTVFMHKKPDGDTIGSSCALAHALRRMGATVHLACSDPITPKYMRWIKPFDFTTEPIGTVICVDIAATDMAGRYEEVVKGAEIVIDHHESNAGFGRLNLVRPEAAAAGEIVYDIIHELMPIDSEIAEPLYVAISTDTGCFRHGSTTAYTHFVASKLMEAGLDIAALNRLLFVVQSRAAVLLRNKMLDTMTEYMDGKAVCVMLTQAMIDGCGATEDDMENIGGLALSIEGVTVAVTLREMGNDTYKASLRSAGPVNVAEVCAVFGGGGHAMAAGCTIHGTEAECKAAIMDVVCQKVAQ